MPVYKYYRKKKWFSYIQQGNPGDFVQAIYRGSDEAGVPDPLLGPNGGVPGQTYIVGLLTSKASAVAAPCPDFCNGGEAFRSNKTDRTIMNAFQNTSEHLEKLFIREKRKYLKSASTSTGVKSGMVIKQVQKSKSKAKSKK